jgi:hypothetical protein
VLFININAVKITLHKIGIELNVVFINVETQKDNRSCINV